MSKLSPDALLRTKVLAEIAWDTMIDETHVDVDVANGVVTLVGTVGSYAEKLAAQDAAQVIEGVHDLINRIDVKPSSEMHPTDDELRSIVEQVLSWDALVPEQELNVQVSEGWVTLTGACEIASQANEARRAISHLAGVRGVADDITISTPELSTESVRESIATALERRASHRAHHIDVVVNGRSVTLAGVAQSANEKRAILGSVAHAPGIVCVIDEIEISPQG